jgi:NADH dehydrogenase (ubiquinone) Fe-S protein 2
MAQEHTYAIAVEKLFNIPISRRYSYIRVIMLELTRILNHLMAVTTHALDVGALSPFLLGFEEREKFMEIYEEVSGARLHAAYIRPGGLSQDITKETLIKIDRYTREFLERIHEIELLLSSNYIWRNRLIDIGKVSKNFGQRFSYSGVLMRSTGIAFDIRLDFPYETYTSLDFQTYVSRKGDTYDRYLLRIYEMKESVSIIQQALMEISK